jgi:hypothetical protein
MNEKFAKELSIFNKRMIFGNFQENCIHMIHIVSRIEGQNEVVKVYHKEYCKLQYFL